MTTEEIRDRFGRLMVPIEHTGPALSIHRLHPDAILPLRSTEGSAGYDVHAYRLSETNRPSKFLLSSHSTCNVETGLIVRAPSNHIILVCSRSGMAARSIFVANAPGVIDPDYTGELRVLLFNGGPSAEYIEHGQRIAQLLILPITIFPLQEIPASALPTTNRGPKGFGSTGV